MNIIYTSKMVYINLQRLFLPLKKSLVQTSTYEKTLKSLEV